MRSQVNSGSLRPIYQKTATYGHFGRSEPEFTWERTDRAAALAEEAQGMRAAENQLSQPRRLQPRRLRSVATGTALMRAQPARLSRSRSIHTALTQILEY